MMRLEPSVAEGNGEDRAERIAVVMAEVAARRQSGEELPDAAICAAHPDLMPELQERLRYLQFVRHARRHAQADQVEPGDRTRTITGAEAGTVIEEDSIPGYQILREIHRGGQGVVYEAIQHSTKRTVAVKVMLEGPFASEHSRWRFEREVTLVARLKHPNIVAVHDSGLAQGRYYFAMDYVRGQPLDTYVRLAGLPLRETVRLFVTICDAVGHAHRLGIIHRDLKPSNILVGEDKDPQVLDFGLAKITAEEAEASRPDIVTVPGNIMGTVRYMSPEQTRGDLDAIDTRTDVYALGVILYELLIGSPPYATGGDVMDAFRNIRETDPLRPSKLRRDIRSDLDAIILKAMQKKPERRYSSADEFRQDLEAWLDGRPVTARSDSSLYVLRRLATRHYFHTSVIVSLIAAIVGFASISFQAQLHAREAVRKLEAANREVVSRNRDIEDAQRAIIRTHGLMSFLLEWGTGRVEAARHIQSLVDPASPEHMAMWFLLDDSVTPEQLQARLPAEEVPLALFVTGERNLKAGRLAEARRAFAEYLSQHAQSCGTWRMLAESRLRELSPTAPARSRPAAADGS